MMDLERDDNESLLSSFGFTQTESLVYCRLLRHSPITGYKLARQIGRPPANIYQSLHGLVEKGAALSIETADEPTSYMPVPPKLLFKALEQAYLTRQSEALRSLEAIPSVTSSIVITQLRTVPQVVERARTMIATATEIIAFDFMPAIYDLFRLELKEASARGVDVVGLAYREEDESASVPFAREAAKGVFRRWPGHGFILVADSRQQLIGLLKRDLDQVVSAIYSDSVFLCCMTHIALVSMIQLTSIRENSSALGAMDPLIDKFPPGMREMTALAGSIGPPT